MEASINTSTKKDNEFKTLMYHKLASARAGGWWKGEGGDTDSEGDDGEYTDIEACYNYYINLSACEEQMKQDLVDLRTILNNFETGRVTYKLDGGKKQCIDNVKRLIKELENKISKGE